MTHAATDAGWTAELTVFTPEGGEHVYDVSTLPVVIGKGRSCAIPLSGWKAGKEHARLTRHDKGIWIEDLGTMAGTWVGGARIVRHGPLDFGDEIVVAGYRMRLTKQMLAVLRSHAPNTALGELPTTSVIGWDIEDPGDPKPLTKGGQDIAPAPTPPAQPSKTEGARILGFGRKPRPAPTDGEPSGNARIPAVPMPKDAATPAQSQTVYTWRQRIHELLLDTIDLRRRDLMRMSDQELREETEALIREIVRQEDTNIHAEVDREFLVTSVLHEAVGLGPLEELLSDPSITEIMVNRYNEVFVEKRGRLLRHGVSFTSDRAVLGIIERIVTPLGRRIDESSPMVDGRLKDGSRVNAVIPPLAIKGPTVTIRKFPAKKLQPSDLIEYNSVSQAMVDFLRVCVEQRKNVIVSGGTGSGKTTFLNVLSNFIPDGERIVTVEDAAELRLNHSHLVSLEARPSNAEGRGAVPIRDLVRNCLRMRPDRIVVGECRGGEALDMLQAMNTGHEGSMTTLHANAPRDAVARLETLVLMAGVDLPLAAVREQIASAVDIIVQQSRFACGSRKITSITEVCGMENGRIQLLELFKFDRKGRDEEGRVAGEFVACGVLPTFYDELREQGAVTDISIFQEARA